MNLLLDTHVFLWAIGDPAKLPPQVVDMLRSNRNQILVSAATAWEITIKAGIDKQMVWQYGPPADLLDGFLVGPPK